MAFVKFVLTILLGVVMVTGVCLVVAAVIGRTIAEVVIAFGGWK